MTLSNVQVSEQVLRLQGHIRNTILSFTMVSPMDPEDVIAVLAFMTGAAVASAPKRHSVRQLREMAVANLDHGLQAHTNSNPAAIILNGGAQ